MDWRIGLYLPWISIFNQTEKRLLEAPFGIPCRELSNFRTNSLSINPDWVSPRNFLMQVAVRNALPWSPVGLVGFRHVTV
jgi:hypothetical protein